MFLTAIAAALNEAAGDAPQSSASAAAAIADAEPISAWHPPSAPEMLAPAVGAATIRPIEAFTSATARAAAQICAMSLPIFAFSA